VPYTQSKALAELETAMANISICEGKVKAQGLIEQLKGTKPKQRSKITGMHISFIQGLIRTRFLKDVQAHCTKHENGEDIDDVEDPVQAAPKWIISELNRQDRDFLRRHSIESTEYDYDKKMFVLRNRNETGPFISVWPFNFVMLYGDHK
jgi:hypothetical protein